MACFQDVLFSFTFPNSLSSFSQHTFATPPTLTIPFTLLPVKHDGDGPQNHPSSQVPIARIATVVIELSRGSSEGGSREERRVALGKMNYEFHRGSVS